MSRRGSAVALGSLPATIIVSDPWELATPVGSPGLRVVLLRRQPADGGDKERVLGRLLDPLRWKDATVGHVVIEARRGDPLLADLEAGGAVSCNRPGGRRSSRRW